MAWLYQAKLGEELESVRRCFPLFIFFCSRVAEGNQLIEVDVFPVGHFVNQAFGKNGEACTDTLYILALMVCVYPGVSRGCYPQASLRLGCGLDGLMRGRVVGALLSGGLPRAAVAVREKEL